MKVSSKLIPRKNNMKNEIKVTLVTILALLLTVFVILWPFAFVWSLNVLFKLSIPFTFKTWLAAYVLLLGTMATRMSNPKKD